MVRGVDYGSILRRDIENDRIAILFGILVNHVEHFAADTIYDFSLVFVAIILKLLLLALERAGKTVTFLRQAMLFFIAESRRAVSQTRLNVFNLFS